jgi:hypothetical protein
MSIYSAPILEAMRSAVEPLAEQANALEADLSEVERGREQLREAKAKAEPARLLFDAAVAVRLELADVPGSRSVEDLAAIARQPKVAAELGKVRPAHMPALFPEVFTRDRPGFDVLIGNPPWEEATVEELGFWAARFPGLKSLRQKDQLPAIARLRSDRADLVNRLADELDRTESQRRALLTGPYPGMGTGDPDVYKAFCWRYWHLVRENGAVGVVLPRSALAVKGSAEWRTEVLAEGAMADATLLLNKGRWVFDMEPRYTVGLVSLRRGSDHHGTLRLRGPYDSRAQYDAGMLTPPAAIPVSEFLTWSDSAALPSIPSSAALRVFRKMRRQRRLDWQPLGGRERESPADRGTQPQLPHLQLSSHSPPRTRPRPRNAGAAPPRPCHPDRRPPGYRRTRPPRLPRVGCLGAEPGSVHSDEERQGLVAELDAVVAHLYDLDDDDLGVIYDTFHTGADYSERYAQVLQYFRSWRKRVERLNEDGG